VTHLTLQQSFAMLSTGGAGWLMLRAGTAKRRIEFKRSRSNCAACGRRRGARGCRCTGRS
jgi:hypothetical protein